MVLFERMLGRVQKELMRLEIRVKCCLRHNLRVRHHDLPLGGT